MTDELKYAIERLSRQNAGYDLAHSGCPGYDSAWRAMLELSNALGCELWYMDDNDYPDEAEDGEEYADFLDRAAMTNNRLIEEVVAEAMKRYEE